MGMSETGLYVSQETKMPGYAQPMNTTRGEIFQTAQELLMESTLG
jgi:hypothetical protein